MANRDCSAGEMIHIENNGYDDNADIVSSSEVSIRPLPEASKENQNWLEAEIQRIVQMCQNRLSCTNKYRIDSQS